MNFKENKSFLGRELTLITLKGIKVKKLINPLIKSLSWENKNPKVP